MKLAFPYKYECDNCHHPDTRMEHDKESDKFLKEHYGIKSENPIFFQCIYCKTGILKPFGYKGEPSFIVECDETDDLGDDLLNLLSF